MYWTERHILACTGNHCNQKGAAKFINKLRFELMRKGLTDRVHMNTCGTIDLCDIGPNLVVYPDNVILSNLSDADVPAVVAFLQGGDLPEELVTSASAPAEKTRREFYAWLDGEGNRVDESAATERAGSLHLPEAFLSEQLRRGFMASKPGDSGTTVVSMTSKARHRYRI